MNDHVQATRVSWVATIEKGHNLRWTTTACQIGTIQHSRDSGAVEGSELLEAVSVSEGLGGLTVSMRWRILRQM